MDKIVYILEYISHAIDLELRLNDMHVAFVHNSNLSKGQLFLNCCIPYTGEQLLDYITKPSNEKKEFNDEAELLIGISAVTIDTEKQCILNYKKIVTLALKGEMICSGQKSFTANVPYGMDLGQQSINLTNSKNIVTDVLDFYKKWNTLTDQKKYDELLSMMALHDKNEEIWHYWNLTEEERAIREKDFIDILSSGYKMIMPKPEDSLKYYGNGKLVRFVHLDGTPAFVLRNDKDEEYPMNFYLHRPKSSVELQII